MPHYIRVAEWQVKMFMQESSDKGLAHLSLFDKKGFLLQGCSCFIVVLLVFHLGVAVVFFL